MSLGQTMLTAGFVVLMIMLTISSNRMLMESSQTVLESEAIDIAADLANSLLIEATRKKFDHYQANYGYYGVSAFTSPSSLGPESGEALTTLPDTTPFQSVSRFNDVDDYNGYTRIVDGQLIKGFKLQATVYYLASRTDLTQKNSKTVLKRIDVLVTHPQYLPRDTVRNRGGITLTRIMTY